MPLFGAIPANQNVEVDPVWVQDDAPAGPDKGELWWDTDETASGITTPLGVTDGGTGATSPASARASLAVPSIGNSTTVAGAPTTGTWARGDQYLDSVGVVWTCVTSGTPGVWKAPPGTELAYDQITANVAVSLGTPGNLVIAGTTRNYDGQPVIAEFFTPEITNPSAGGNSVRIGLWDGATQVSEWGAINASANPTLIPMLLRQRFTPSAGSHNYLVRAYVTGSTCTVLAGTGTAGAVAPAYLRITRA